MLHPLRTCVKRRKMKIMINFFINIIITYTQKSITYPPPRVKSMTYELIFSILAFLITLWSTIVYWKGIFRKEIIPHPFTFFIWIIVLGISSIELVENDEILGSLAIILMTLSNIWILFFGIARWREIRINWLDWFFLISGILLIIFWRLEPNYASVLILMIAIDATAYASSFKKWWLQPFTEQSPPYFISVGNNICTILAISVWNFENLGMWIWTALINFTFACFILARQYSMRK